MPRFYPWIPLTMRASSLATSDLLEQLVPLIRDAGRVIMDIYATDFDVTQKGDASPVTQADQKAEAVILAGLLPIVWGTGTGSEVMSRIAAPMLGGMVTAPLLSLFVIPAVYFLMRRPRRR